MLSLPAPWPSAMGTVCGSAGTLLDRSRLRASRPRFLEGSQLAKNLKWSLFFFSVLSLNKIWSTHIQIQTFTLLKSMTPEANFSELLSLEQFQPTDEDPK